MSDFSQLQAQESAQLDDSLRLIRDVVYKDYYGNLASCDLVPLKSFGTSIGFPDLHHKKPEEMMKLLKLRKITYKKDEDVLEKLTSIYNAAQVGKSRLIFIINGWVDKATEIYIGAVGGLLESEDAIKSLKSGLQGNFAGSELESFDVASTKTLLDSVFSEMESNITSVSSLGSRRDKTSTENKEFLQGIEHLIDAMEGKEYVGVFLTQGVSKDEITEITTNYENLYTTLSQFQKATFTENESDTQGTSETDTTGRATGNNRGRGIAKTVGLSFGSSLGAACIGSLGLSFGLSVSRTASQNWGSFESDNKSKSIGISTSTTKGTSAQYEVTDKNVTQLLETIDLQLERLREGEDYGLFHTGSYFLSTKPENALLAANTYQSLLNGEGVSCERSAINLWTNTTSQTKVTKLKEYLKRGYHPTFFRQTGENQGITCMAATLVTGLALPIHMGLPQKSISGLSVIEHADFGRNILIKNREKKELFTLGQFYHMGRGNGLQVELDKNELTKHCFITGSTGSGKSNTVYSMLDKLLEENVKFMVIEPAKGEYKKVFGGRSDVEVYGTNPYKVPNLLQINPFSFPVEDTHVLEHIDRLVEVFNACWPMYAAMPAILKEAVEKSYLKCGWNLSTSLGSDKFPTFDILLETLPEVVESSQYSKDTSSDYKGALVTRVRSLTTGIFGQIFKKDLDNEKLFNENVIIDLSRVGSQETKALIMGILVLKLQESRMSEDTGSDEKLRHVTVLEEAHNLLKRTSSEQSQEGSNLQGKSVEMLANAIAEMRTYGEGFIIADQSPGLLDMSVIRNTNTKIIMRLPDEEDRKLVGKAAALNDDQIIELAKLECGVAAVSESGWLEPVLCQVDLFDKDKKKPMSQKKYQWVDVETVAVRKFLDCAFCGESYDLSSEEVDSVKKWMNNASIDDDLKEEALKALYQVIRQEKLEKYEHLPISACLMNEYLLPLYLQDKTKDEVLENIIQYLNLEKTARLYTQLKENVDDVYENIHLMFPPLENSSQMNHGEAVK
ncbi:MAG: ATP-binding protein [Eubacteriales bacterium]